VLVGIGCWNELTGESIELKNAGHILVRITLDGYKFFSRSLSTLVLPSNGVCEVADEAGRCKVGKFVKDVDGENP